MIIGMMETASVTLRRSAAVRHGGEHVQPVLIGRALGAVYARKQREGLQPHAAGPQSFGGDDALFRGGVVEADLLERVAVSIRNEHGRVLLFGGVRRLSKAHARGMIYWIKGVWLCPGH